LALNDTNHINYRGDNQSHSNDDADPHRAVAREVKQTVGHKR
jgi:hypothetical protein